MATSPRFDEVASLRAFQGQREAAARHLGISRTTLWRRLKACT
jgi:propionate catabolism operon transcriptional regulator